MKPHAWIVAALLIGTAAIARAETVTFPCTADTSICAYGDGGEKPDERNLARGTATSIKIKHRENQLAMRFDLAAWPARKTVTSAVLRVKMADSDPKYALNHVAASTIPTSWDEKTVTFNRPEPDQWWGPQEGKFNQVTFGNYGTVSGVARAKSMGNGWWEIPIAPRIIHALRDSFGLALMDESGLFKDKYANVFLCSRETKFKPELVVQFGKPDTVAPSPVRSVALVTGPDAGSLFLDITAGGNDGDAGTALGYEVRYLKDARVEESSWENATVLPRMITPRPVAAGGKSSTFIEGLEPGASYSFGVVAVDESDNRSPLASTPLVAARPRTEDRLDTLKPLVVKKGEPLAANGLALWAVSGIEQVDPVSGQTMIGESYRESDVRLGNTVYNGQDRCVELTALKGEQVDFQVVLERQNDAMGGIDLSATNLEGEGGAVIAADGHVELGRVWYLKDKDHWLANAVPDLGKDAKMGVPAADNAIPDQKYQTIFVQIFVPYNATPGSYKGTIRAQWPAGSLELPVRLTVVDLTMPKRLGFEVELNNYSDRRPVAEFHEIHRIAHKHRVGYNVVPYSHQGTPTVPYVPRIEGEGDQAHVADFAAWDEYMGPLLTGEAFADLPRAGEPLRWAYLPFFEGYPLPLTQGYARPDLVKGRPTSNNKEAFADWQDKVSREEPLISESFSKEWVANQQRIAKEFYRHFEEKKYTSTKYHVIMNNVPFKGSYTNWTLCEPAWGRDFRALAFFQRMYVDAARDTQVEVLPRNGISRPQWQGDRMDGIEGFSDLGRGYVGCFGLVRRRMLERGCTYWCYGGGTGNDRAMAMQLANLTHRWCTGLIGNLPYWTSFHGGKGAWDKNDNLATLLPPNHGYKHWTATIKLKALRRGQQDMELLNLLAAQEGWDRWRVARAVTAVINLASKDAGANPEDPRGTDYSKATVEDFHRLRMAVIEKLLALKGK